MKYLVETTGPFSLVDMGVQNIEMNHPNVVHTTPFVQSRVATGELTVVAELPDEATQDDFLGFWRSSKTREQAIESYKSKFEPQPQPQAQPQAQPKGKGGRPRKNQGAE